MLLLKMLLLLLLAVEMIELLSVLMMMWEKLVVGCAGSWRVALIGAQLAPARRTANERGGRRN